MLCKFGSWGITWNFYHRIIWGLNFAVKNDLCFNCKYLIKGCIGLCNYIHSIDNWTQRGCLAWKLPFFCYVHGSVHRESVSISVQQDATTYSLLYFCRLLYMFRVVTPPITRSTCNCNQSIWHWSNRLCYLPLWWRSWNFQPPLWRSWNFQLPLWWRSWNFQLPLWWRSWNFQLPLWWRSWNFQLPLWWRSWNFQLPLWWRSWNFQLLHHSGR